MARPDPVRVRQARLTGAATAVRDALVLGHDPDREERQRGEWPELWAAIDRLLDALEYLGDVGPRFDRAPPTPRPPS